MNRERLRPLVIRNQGLKHPFRQSLPVNIVQMTREERDLDAITKEKGLGEDVSLFLLSFLAFFTAFYMFIF
jgi:hypothetical protein